MTAIFEASGFVLLELRKDLGGVDGRWRLHCGKHFCAHAKKKLGFLGGNI